MKIQIPFINILITQDKPGEINMSHEIPKILRFEDLKSLFKISRSSIARWEEKKQFPRRIRIGSNSIGWCSNEVRQWLENRSRGKQK